MSLLQSVGRGPIRWSNRRYPSPAVPTSGPQAMKTLMLRAITSPPQKMQQQRVRPRSKLEIGPMSVNDICCMIPPWFGASAPWNPCEITTRFPRAVITSSRVGFLGVLGMLVKSLLKGLKMSSATSRSGGRELGSEGFCSAMEAFQSLVRIKTSSILDTSIAVRVIQRDT